MRNINFPLSTYAGNKVYFIGTEKHCEAVRQFFLSFHHIKKILSFLLDYLLFIVFSSIIGWGYAVSYVIARVTSGIFNYALNAKVVFGKASIKCFLKYLCVWAIILALGTLGGELLNEMLHFPEIVCKLFVDLPLFVLSYYLQKSFVFKR